VIGAVAKRRTYLLLFCLTLVAGYADAVAFFGFGVFTANMTGNTVLLGGALAGRIAGRLPGAIGVWLPLLSIAGFVAGGAAAALFLRNESAQGHRTSAVLLLVASLLALTAALHRWGGARAVPLDVTLLSAVMGLQSIVAVRAGVEGVSTTYVTGTLVRSLMNFLGTAVHNADLRSEGRANAAVWALYLGGAFAGAVALRLLGAGALWIPAAVVALLPLVL